MPTFCTSPSRKLLVYQPSKPRSSTQSGPRESKP